MPLGRRPIMQPREIPVQNIRVGDLIEVSWESHGITTGQRSYVGEIRRNPIGTVVIAANGHTKLACYEGTLITHPAINARVFLLRAAPEPPEGLFDV